MDLPNESTQPQIYDIIVVGLGAMGSASFYHACLSGKSVLGIEQYDLLHTKGSSHGETRALRESYFEGSFYIPMVKESLKMWKELEVKANEKLYTQTGALMVGKKGSQMLKVIEEGYEKFNIKYEKLSAEEIKSKYEEFKLFSDEQVGILETGAGILFPEKCIQNMIRIGLETSKCSKILTNTEVVSITENKENLVTVELSNQMTYYSKKVILSPGMWATEFLKRYSPQYKDILKIQENTLFWFETQAEAKFSIGQFPLFFVQCEELNKYIYGFPKISGNGLTKFALHNSGRQFNSYLEYKAYIEGEQSHQNQQINKEFMMKCIESTFDENAIKSLKNECNCFYTNTPDEHFIIDYLNGNPNMVFLSPCSGHGFKFAIYIGKLAVEMTEEYKLKHEEFAFKRFNKNE